jgi:hypothetical protein
VRWVVAAVMVLAVAGAASVLLLRKRDPVIVECRIEGVGVKSMVSMDADSGVRRAQRSREVAFDIVATIQGMDSERERVYGELRLGESGPALHLSWLVRDDPTTAAPNRPDDPLVMRCTLCLDLPEQPDGHHLCVDDFKEMLIAGPPMAVRLCVCDDERVLAESAWMDTKPHRDKLLALLRAK